MSLTIPDSFQWPSDEAAEPVAFANIVRALQIKAAAESSHLAAFGGESITTTSSSYVTALDEIAITVSASDQDRILVDVRATNTTIRVTISDGASSVNSSGSTSPAGNISLTINTSSLSGVDLTAKIEQKRVSGGTSTIAAGSIREKRHTTSTIT
jgi:hypothetical protein